MKAFMERGLDCLPVILGQALATLGGKAPGFMLSRWLSGEDCFPQIARAPWVDRQTGGRLAARWTGRPHVS